MLIWLSKTMRTSETMYPLVEDYLSSGLSQQQFCDNQPFTVSTFGYWVRKYKQENEEASPTGFITLNPTVLSGQAEVIYPNGVRIVLSSVNVQLLRELVR
jgi:hypothetical protein